MKEDIISVSIKASPEKVYQIITNLEKIKNWEPSHRLPLIVHEWFPSDGVLKTGNVLKIKSPLWTFVAKCIELKENEVRWEFMQGPLKGTESWIVKQSDKNCIIIKLLEYDVAGHFDRLLWRLVGRRIHKWASLRQLEGIKKLAEVTK